MYLRLAARNIFRNRTRSLITLSAIAFGLTSLILAAGFIQDSIGQLQERYIHDFLGHIHVVRNGFFEEGLVQPYDYMISNPSEVIETIASVEHVVALTPRLEFPGLLSTGDTTIPFLAQGIDMAAEKKAHTSFTMDSGENLSEGDIYEVTLGKGIAQAMKAKTGKSLVILANTTRGAINALDVSVKGVFRTISKAFDDHAIRIPMRTAQKLLRTDKIQSITIFLDDTKNTDPVQQRLTLLFKERHLDLEARTWDKLEEADFVVKVVPFYERLFAVLRIIILGMVILSIFNTMNMSVLERIGEIGTIMALGTRKKGVMLLFLSEGFLLGLCGGVVGLIAGYSLAHLISWIGIPMPTAPGSTMLWVSRIRVIPSACLSGFALVVLTSVLSSLFPAFKASKLEIAQALRHNV